MGAKQCGAARSSSSELALPESSPSPCCPKGAYGPCRDVASHGLQGTYEGIGDGLWAYVTGRSGESASAVLVASDIYGFDTGRHMEIADTLAGRCRCLVVMPDFFHGAAPQCEGEPRGLSYYSRLPRVVSCVRKSPWGRARADVGAALAFLGARGASGPVAVVGFCWGAFPVWKACADPDLAPRRLACGVSMHPSLHAVAGLVGEDADQIVSSVRCPQLVVASKDEPAEWKPGGKVDSAVRSLGGEVAAGSKFQAYEERQHGWVTRGSFDDEGVERDFNAAIDATVEFIVAHCGGCGAPAGAPAGGEPWL